MVVLCLGLQSSASTWIYNVVRLILGENICSFDSTNLTGLEDFITGRPRHILIKAHTISTAMLQVLSHLAVKTIVSTRDPRDAAASLKQRIMPSSFDAIQNVNRALAGVLTGAKELSGLQLCYEDRFFEDPSVILQIAEYLEVEVSPDQAQSIFESMSPESVSLAIKRSVSGDANHLSTEGNFSFDPLTRFNERHLGDTKSGKWISAFEGSLSRDLDLLWPSELSRSLYSGYCTTFTRNLFSDESALAMHYRGPGLMVLWSCFLPAGRWNLKLHGSIPTERIGSAVVVHNRRVVGRGQVCKDGKLMLDVNCTNDAHDVPFTVHVNPVNRQKLSSDDVHDVQLRALCIEPHV